MRFKTSQVENEPSENLKQKKRKAKSSVYGIFIFWED